MFENEDLNKLLMLTFWFMVGLIGFPLMLALVGYLFF